MVDESDDRRRVLLIGPPDSGALERAIGISRECRLWQGREGEQGYAYRVAGLVRTAMPTAPFRVQTPFRAPHYSFTRAALEGQLRGHRWLPGELHLAHGGVLFLDQAPKFRADALEAVAQAWDCGCTPYSSPTVEDCKGDAALDTNRLYPPTYFSLVLSAWPCPCGYRGVENGSCSCTDRQVESWFERIRIVSHTAVRVKL